MHKYFSIKITENMYKYLANYLKQNINLKMKAIEDFDVQLSITFFFGEKWWNWTYFLKLHWLYTSYILLQRLKGRPLGTETAMLCS